MKMTFVHPAQLRAAAAKEKAKAARSQAVLDALATTAKEAIAKKAKVAVAEATANVVAEVETKAKAAVAEAVTNATEAEKLPVFAADRGYRVKEFYYQIFDKKRSCHAVTILTGTPIPKGTSEIYAESRREFSQALKDYREARIHPTRFAVLSRETSDYEGFGYLGPDFVGDDPKYLANDLAHIDAHLHPRGFKLFLAEDFGFDNDAGDYLLGSLLEGSRPDDIEIPPASKDIPLHFVNDVLNWNVHIKIFKGDEIPERLWYHYQLERLRYANMLKSSNLGVFTPTQFVLYNARRPTADGSQTFYEHDPKAGTEHGFRIAHRMEKAAEAGFGFQYLGRGRMPLTWPIPPLNWHLIFMTADDLAHISCRFAAHGFLFAVVPHVDDKKAKVWRYW